MNNIIKSLHPYDCPSTISVTNNVIASKLLFIQLGSTIFEISFIFFVQCLPHGIFNYLLRKGFITKGSVLTVKLQVVDRVWPVKLCAYEGMYQSSSCKFSGGWSAFATENTLRVGDVCVFELIIKDDVVLKVHIFRCLD